MFLYHVSKKEVGLLDKYDRALYEFSLVDEIHCHSFIVE